MKLTVLVDITGDNSGEQTAMCVSVQGKERQRERLRRIALIITQFVSGSLHVGVGHFSRWGCSVQTAPLKGGRGWSENISTEKGCLMVFTG